MRANPVQARLAYRMDSGAWREINLAKDAGPSSNIAADGKIDLRFLAWTRAGKLNLAKGDHTVHFRMNSENQNHGYIDCFVLADEPFRPNGTLKPGQTAAAEKGFFVFDPKPDPLSASSGVDLRFLNEKTAGDGGHSSPSRDRRFVH